VDIRISLYGYIRPLSDPNWDFGPVSRSELGARRLTIFSFNDLDAPYVLLEDRLALDRPARLFSRPVEIIRCEDTGEVDRAFGRIEAGLARGLHAAGLLSYELGYALEPKLARLMPQLREVPLLWFGLFKAPRLVDPQALDNAFASLGAPPPIKGLSSGNDRLQHLENVEEVLRLIAAGDVYQVNLTFPLRFQYADDPLRLYGALRTRQPVAHGGVATLGDMTVLSVSPELWVETRGDQAMTRPMKGTSARGEDMRADQTAREALAADPKQQAENLMIVDLLRNDLARISTPGSVRVPALFTVETYPSFHTLTSTITSTLDAGRTLRERIAALFPCGSIVGAPKVRAAEIIRSLEPSPRGVYTGGLGAVAPNGDMAFNVAIRTAVVTPDGEGRYHVGGGIIADSDPGAEYEEACLKARVLTDLADDYALIETFRWSCIEGLVRLDLHLDRLARSARQLGFVFDRTKTEQALYALVVEWAPGDRRLRLLLERDGTVEITHGAIVTPSQPLKVDLAVARVDPGDPFLRHKTTRRSHYDQTFEAAVAKGFDEVIFLNRRGEVAEASRNSIFVEVGGRLITPPVSSGALPGVLRGQLISCGRVFEEPVSLRLLQFNPMMLGNSLHGLRPASLATEYR
jgi:para-aminobenzoate synthetase / 4-amino-4-deoxychorismate lyase